MPPDHVARATLATPPATDVDFSSLSSYDSDVLSDLPSDAALSDILSDAEHAELSDPDDLPSHTHDDPGADADADAEAEAEPGGDGAHSPAPSLASVSSIYRTVQHEADVWSVDGGSELEHAVDGPWDSTGSTPRPRRLGMHHKSVWDRGRSGSSPSRSPARQAPRWRVGEAPIPSMHEAQTSRSFYDYLFS